MKVSQLMEKWQSSAKDQSEFHQMNVHIHHYDLARLSALAEMYAPNDKGQLLSELISVALDEVQERMPYVKGNKVIARDEEGDPIYEDIGPTPRFLSLSKKFQSEIKQAT